MLDSHIISAVKIWIDRFVISLNLCPFARREIERDNVRFKVSQASTEVQLLQSLLEELERLEQDPGVETTFLIHPDVLQDFYDFNQFLGDCEQMLIDLELDGVYQIASFHPQYQFAQTEPEDAENFSNRSPYPMLHILREQSVEQAIADYPDVDGVPARNLETLNELGPAELQRMWQDCFDE